MWFGDLVTMKWWNGIWLNEAFATFMEMKCHRRVPSRVGALGQLRPVAHARRSTSTRSRRTRPIEFQVVSPEDAEGMFDVLTYEKGAAVVRMLEQYLGEDDFRDGIRHYLSLHQYSQHRDHRPVGRDRGRRAASPSVGSWTPGSSRAATRWSRPTSSATGHCGCARNGSATRSTKTAAAAETEPTWAVPILYRWSAGGRTELARVLLTEREHDVELPEPVDWVQLNAGGFGFYRTALPRLAPRPPRRPMSASFTPLERYNLVDDAFAVGSPRHRRARPSSSTSPGASRDDTDLAVWQRLAGAFGALDRIVDDDNACASPSHRAQRSPRPRSIAWVGRRARAKATATARRERRSSSSSGSAARTKTS